MYEICNGRTSWRKVRKLNKKFKKDIKRFDRLMEYAQKMANYEIPANTPVPK